VAVALALQEEFQSDLNRMIANGRLAEAKVLSRYQTKIVQALSDMKKRIGAAELEEAERRSRSLVTVELDVRSTPEQFDEAEPEALSWKTMKEKENERAEPLPPWLSEKPDAGRTRQSVEAERARRRLRFLLYALSALIVVYGIVMFPRIKDTAPTLLSIRDFSGIEALESVVPRPPSLYVRLDTEQWQASTPEERRQMLEEMGRVAGAAGYNGVHARTGDGATVGEWLKNTGVRLFRRTSKAS
jgi:hypothetical protein